MKTHYTQEELKKFSQDELKNLPWNYEGMVMLPGRYYYGMFFLPLDAWPGMPFGGDLNGTLWRYDDKPTEWITTMRIRINADRGSPWEYRDRKVWNIGKGTFATEAEAVRSCINGVELATGVFGQTIGKIPKPEWILIKGDGEKAMNAMLSANKSWMHVKRGKL